MQLKHLWHVLSMSSTTSVSHIQSYRHYQDQAGAQESTSVRPLFAMQDEAPAAWCYQDCTRTQTNSEGMHLLLLFCIMLGILQLPQTCRYNTEQVWLDPQVHNT